MRYFNFTNTIAIDNQAITTVLNLDRPRLALFSNFLSSAECDELIELARPAMQRSHVINPIGEGTMQDSSRTSNGMFFQRQANALVNTIETRISNLLHIPLEHGEGIQILNYHIGGEYKPHHDYFKPNEKGEQPYTKIGGQRMATFLMYLNDVEAGGETIFPTLGVEFMPVKGSALFFYYELEDNEVDIHSLHGGNPVTRGQKWVATKWLRQQPYINK
jgi:prolyl 4-hydroxylase